MIASLVFLFIQLLFALFFFYPCIAFFTGAPFVPSSNVAADAMIRLAGNLKGKKSMILGPEMANSFFLQRKKEQSQQ